LPVVPPKASHPSPPELAELIRLSRAIGGDPDLVQGGGGNTSVKTAGRESMYVKASGTALAEMDTGRGWCELDLSATLGLLATPGLAELAAREREERVLALLRAAARRPALVRPSAEACLHALLDRVVVHSHPVQLTAFLCARDSRDRWSELLSGVGERRTLYVPYVDPGFTLAARLETEIAAFERKGGLRPQVVLLENHGLFVAAPTVEECLELHEKVAAAGRRWCGRERVNPRPSSAPPNARGVAPSAAGSLVRKVRGSLLRGGAPHCLVELDRSEVATEFLENEELLAVAEAGAFTPDLIVYCRTHPLVLRGDDVKRWDAAVSEYRARHGLDPRVVLVPGRGVLHVGVDRAQLRVVAETHRLGLAALLASPRAGGPRLLDRRAAGFIEEWEVEKFRAALGPGRARPLAGRIACVLGAPNGVAAVVVRALGEAGATASLGFDAGGAEAGGLDVVVDTVRALAPDSPLFNRLLELFAEQGTGGEIVVLGTGRIDLERLAGPVRSVGVRVLELPPEVGGAEVVARLRRPG
jgi:rhamnose utilization protein RhaD (predicted bifunctional aldolase and dehydrogenase)